MNGIIVQEFASLGFPTFKGIILFLKHILKVGWLNHKKYYNERKKNLNMKKKGEKHGVNLSNYKCVKGKSKSNEYKHLREISRTMSTHANELKIHPNTMEQRWVTYKHNRDNKFFDNNVKLAKVKQQQFDKLQQQLWREYHNNPDRITNLTLSILNRRQSYRDVADNRVAVSKILICRT